MYSSRTPGEAMQRIAPVGEVTPPFAALDFFAGSGLVTEGLKPYFSVHWANDVCVKKANVYRANHGADHFHHGPIEEVTGRSLPSAILSWASFPCQDLSLAGKMGGIDAARSGLVWHWLRVLDEMESQPSIVVAENVLGLVSAKGGAHYHLLHKALTARGYRVGPLVLDAANWLPQSRPRVFVVGVTVNESLESLESWIPTWAHPRSVEKAIKGLDDVVFWNLPAPRKRKTMLADLVDFDAPTDTHVRTTRNLSLIPDYHWQRLQEAARAGLRVASGYKRTREGKQCLELRFDGVAGCLRTPEGGSSRQLLVFPAKRSVKTRLISARETARLMGAPEHYQLPQSYNEAYKAMGDAVAVPVVKYLAKHLLVKLAQLAEPAGVSP